MKAAAHDAAMSQEQLEQLKRQLQEKESELEKISSVLESIKKENEVCFILDPDLDGSVRAV